MPFSLTQTIHCFGFSRNLQPSLPSTHFIYFIILQFELLGLFILSTKKYFVTSFQLVFQLTSHLPFDIQNTRKTVTFPNELNQMHTMFTFQERMETKLELCNFNLQLKFDIVFVFSSHQKNKKKKTLHPY